ncbi:MAG: VOC family protein [Myxococcota bacterium]|nr:VOC family protein [Myxococcota bacterium]
MGTRMAKPALDVGLITADATPLLDFYRAVASFELLDPLTIPNVGTIHKLACGESILRVMVPTTPPEPDEAVSFSARAGIRYLTLEVEDIEQAVEAVRSHGGSVALEPFELRPGRRVAQVTDPDGNMLELGQG